MVSIILAFLSLHFVQKFFIKKASPQTGRSNFTVPPAFIHANYGKDLALIDIGFSAVRTY